MDNKILQQNLADALAERTNVTKRKAEAFVRSFFEATEEALIQDGIVKVKGFGTTKIVSVSERESVNINTGERFQIESHDKISFTPDNNFRDLVNRPFAHFTTIVLEDSVDESELATDVEPDYEIEDETTIETTPEPVIEEEPEPVIEEAPEPIAEEIPEPIELAPVPKEAEELLIELPEAEENEEILPDENPAENEDINPENETDMQQQPIIIQNSVPTHNWWKTAFIILTMLVMMTLSYFAGYYRIFCPCDAPVVPADTAAAVVTNADTTAGIDVATAAEDQTDPQTEKVTEKRVTEEKTTAKDANATAKQDKASDDKKAAAKYKQMGGEYLITGVLERHTMKAGDNLYKLANKAYGDKELATYIIFHNNIKNPDVIGLGQTIEIPKLSKK